MPSSKSPSASVHPPATAKHYVVLDAVGNCAVVDAKPADGLKIIGDSSGYSSSESANKALKDSRFDGTIRIDGMITINGMIAIIGATMIVIVGTVGTGTTVAGGTKA
jgi:hypothetical protein